MKIVIASIALGYVSATADPHYLYKRNADGFCVGKLAGNYQSDAPESGNYYVCNTDEDEHANAMMCGMGNSLDADGNNIQEQLVYNPNNGNADCSIVSPGGFCDFAANVDFTSNGGMDASIDCTADAGSGDAATTTTTEAATTTTMVPPAGYDATYCATEVNGNYILAADCAEGYFYQCANGYTYLQQCGTGTVFSPSLGTCDWASDVADCATPTVAATTAAPAAPTTADPAAPTTVAAASEVVSCDWSTLVCETTNWCNGMESGFHVPDDAAIHESGVYYHCNGGEYSENTCAEAGTKWYIPDPLPAGATGWYGWCQ